MAKDIEYSEKYLDEHFEYRHVIMPKALKSEIPRARLMLEHEWRAIGVTQSRGWMHYMIHTPEPHILLFRRPIGTDPRSGKAPVGWQVPETGISKQEAECWLNDPNAINNHKQKLNDNKKKGHHNNNYNQSNKENHGNSENKYY